MRRRRANREGLQSSHLIRLANQREQVTPGEPLPPGVLSTLRVCEHAKIPVQSMAMVLQMSVTDILRELRRNADDTK